MFNLLVLNTCTPKKRRWPAPRPWKRGTLAGRLQLELLGQLADLKLQLRRPWRAPDPVVVEAARGDGLSWAGRGPGKKRLAPPIGARVQSVSHAFHGECLEGPPVLDTKFRAQLEIHGNPSPASNSEHESSDSSWVCKNGSWIQP